MHRLHNKMIDEIESQGGDPDKLWLVETHSYGEFSLFYGDNTLEDLTSNSPREHQTIVYYHENGDILSHCTFDERNEVSLENAAKEMAFMLN